MPPDPVFDSAYAWLLAGVMLAALEALGIPGVGLLFAGLGALTVGMAVYLGLLSGAAYAGQWIVFFVASAAWAYALWKPLQKFRLSKTKSEYRNIVGDTAYVTSANLTKKDGEVTWSGTIMKARLADNIALESLAAGTQVTIVDVTGATLIVKPKE